MIELLEKIWLIVKIIACLVLLVTGIYMCGYVNGGIAMVKHEQTVAK